MKSLKIVSAAFLLTISSVTFAQSTEKATVKVWGNCSMCESVIEKAAKIDGVVSADWDETTKMLQVVYKSSKTDLLKIQEKIAAKGYDTEKVRANDDVYAKLHGCCKYERELAASATETKKEQKKEGAQHHQVVQMQASAEPVVAVKSTGTNAVQTYKEATLQASGLTCALCTNAINSALEQLDFIGDISVDLNTSSFNIKFKEGKAVNFDGIRDAVQEAGFSVAKLSVLTNFDAVKVKQDSHVEVGGLNLHFMSVKEQQLNGDKWLAVVDKNFVGAKEYKKYSKATTLACYETGQMGACCTGGAKTNSTRIYHVTL